MTDTLSSTQSWAQLANGASLGGSGIFGLSGTHKHKGGSGHPAATSAGRVSDPSLSFNKLFANDLSQNALSETDPSGQYAAAQQSADKNPTATVAEATAGSDDTAGLSGPLSPGLLAYLMGMTAPPAATTTDNQAATDAAAATAGDDTAPAAPAATALGNQTASTTTPDPLQEILSELAELAGTAPADQGAMPSAAATTTAATDTLPAEDGTQTVTDQSQTDPAGSPAALQATALVEMQKALTAYFSGSLTSSNATAAATSIAI